MNLKLYCSTPKLSSSGELGALQITGSKSETNRLLLLQALYPNITLENTSNSDDSAVMSAAFESKNTTIDIHHAGTAMRFLTAYFAQKEGAKVVLTGSKRMKERPIKILVDALRQLDVAIEYLENEDFPPIKISGKAIKKNKVSIQANVSSQYISALLLIAPKLKNGLELTLIGEITSVPYIKMTLSLLQNLGIETSFISNKIVVKPISQILNSKSQIIESDWSSASYFYSIVALSPNGTTVTLSSFKQNSLQGDSALVGIYEKVGVKTFFKGNEMTLIKQSNTNPDTLNLDLNSCPDIAQTITVTCFGLGIACSLRGLHTLKIKETDRLEALKTELSKLGATISVTANSLHLEKSNFVNTDCVIKTYQDHRMAMAFATLALKTSIIIEDAEVVSKSYPNFWNDLKIIGITIDEI